MHCLQKFVGACFLGVLGRLRWSDVLKVRKIAIDRGEDGFGYLECEQLPGKTAVSKEAKTSLMLVAASLIGLNDKCTWAETWVALLNEFQVIVEGRLLPQQ